jgi:adenosylcobinamide-phosphate synthase
MKPRPAALLLAVGLDLVAGEPPDRWHPVAWIGRALAWAESRAPGRSSGAGAVALGAVAALAWGAAGVIAAAGRRLGAAGLVLETAALKPAFAVRRLGEAACEVGAALRAEQVEQARSRLGRDLVSRETGGLSLAEVTSAAIESVAENLTDSVAAPLLAYAVGGLPAAWVYRTVNTADAMWGYRDARYERFGKPAARLDDAANLVPARLGALALAAGAAVVGEDARRAWRGARRDHARTSSPNAGWTMGAMAGALGVGLKKRGAYHLGDRPLVASPAAIDRAVRVFAAASVVAVAGALVVACFMSRRGR